jgi:hypothetical protein
MDKKGKLSSAKKPVGRPNKSQPSKDKFKKHLKSKYPEMTPEQVDQQSGVMCAACGEKAM